MRSLALLFLAASAALPGEVVDFQVSERSAVLAGAEFGSSGAYERIVGRADFEVDPEAAANRNITDLKLAKRNRRGRVEFSADVYILTPVDSERGSGTLLFEVSNRGGKGLLRFNNADSSRDPRTREEFGDGFLLEQGHTLVWVGWQFDLIASEHALRMEAPVARGVSGWTRSHFSPSQAAKTFSVAGAGHRPYEAVDPADPNSKLIVRDWPDGPGREIPRDQWRFVDGSTVSLHGGFAAGKTYDVVYRAKDPAIAGLGAAAIRDFISYAKSGPSRSFDPLKEHHENWRRAIAYGSSQSGRFLRTFLLEGFNADEQGRQVFEGMWPHVAGAARGSFTHRFAQPTRQDPFYTVEIFPFRDLPDRDPITGGTGGILSRAQQDGVVPKMVYTLTSSEYWNRSASLLHTTLDGTSEAQLPNTTRIYYVAGTQHGAGSVPPQSSPTLEYALNSNDYRPVMRAVWTALEKWLADGTEPPASKYPAVDELAALAHLDYPAIPGLRPLISQRRAMRLDFGREYQTLGIIAYQPPNEIGARYPAKLPQLNDDGNERGGVRLPALVEPLATYGGWNRFKPGVADADHNPGNSGSTIPFPTTREKRMRANDPRPAIQERYQDRSAYQERVEAAASALVAEGFLLEQDVEGIVDRNLALWDYLVQ